jgi:adenylate cyclase
MSRTERKLAAILAADVAGYSKLVERNEEKTLRAFQGHLSALEPVIGSHAGRIVKTMGDGFLVEFGSVVDAVSCAATMQRRMFERNSNEVKEESLVFRMGVHVGDVVVDGDDILGDGVNVAARLESIARAGGISVSGRVFDDVENKLDLVFKDTGFQELKNLARPIQVFEVELDDSKVEYQTPDRPDKPSLAVLPFLNMSPDPEQEYFADGLSEDLITALSHVPSIFVIARNSSFTYKGLAIDLRRVGEELGVRYVLEGSVRKSGNRLRVTGQLIDTETGSHVWADRYDGTLEDVFDLQDKITSSVVGAIAPMIQTAEIERVSRKRPENLTAYDFYLKAVAALNNIQTVEAAEYLDKAIAAAPDYAKAKAVRAWCYSLFGWRGLMPNEDERQAAIRLCEEALASPNADVEARAYAGYTLAFMGKDIERGIDLVEDATILCPSLASAWASMALLEYYYRDPEQAIKLGEAALRLNPRDPLSFRCEMAISPAHLILGQYESCLEYADQGLRKVPDIPFFVWFRIASLVHSDRLAEAQKAADKFMARHPEFKISNLEDMGIMLPGFTQAIAAMDGPLRRVGVPD